MATDTKPAQTTDYVLPPELWPDVEHLVTEDDTPVDGIFSEKQMRLLTSPLHSSPGWAGEGRKFVALANVGLFYAIRQPPYVPDMMLSLDVELPEDVHPKPHRSYFMWEYGKPPDVVIEIVSNKEGGEDTEKLAGYARIGVRYYVIYDPEQLLDKRTLRGFELQGMEYQPLAEPFWLPGVELGLRLWQGRFEDYENTWLRWVDAAGEPIPTGVEQAEQHREVAQLQRQRAEQQRRRADEEHQRAEAERQKAEAERQKAEGERQRADRLAEQLRRLGIDPENP
jgi:Uma2 family endonuclease